MKYSVRRSTSVFSSSPLALRAIVRAALRHQGSPDGGAASEAWFSGALIKPMLDLEKAAAAFSVYVIGDRGATFLYGLRLHFHNSRVQPFDALRA